MDEGKAAQKGRPPPPSSHSISLPKSGAAVTGLGETFTANPATGSGALSVPIAASPARSGAPELRLSYDSGSGSGPFGLGWSLSLPAIARKTDRGLPHYDDENESDVFILSGAEDLVPLLDAGGLRSSDSATAPGYTIRRYRPRIEGLFARIERWTRDSDGETHWRSLTRDNLLNLYGSTAQSRIADPADPSRVFSWLISETRDDRGNAILYGYKAEDGAGCDLGRACERNRGGAADPGRTANRYPKRISYGNRRPLLDSAGRRPLFLADLPAGQLNDAGWMFELVFDYGEHDLDSPEPADDSPWAFRDDPFSSYRPGFELRTTRLCRRALMFHHVPPLADGGAGYEGMVRSTEFQYSPSPADGDSGKPLYTTLNSVTRTGWRRSGDSYVRRSLPPLEFGYSQAVVRDEVEEVDPSSLENLPAGVDGERWRWLDLHGEGSPGILAGRDGALFYKRNLSPLQSQGVALAPLESVSPLPATGLDGGRGRFLDLGGDGLADLVLWDRPTPGLYKHDRAEGWHAFRPFPAFLDRALDDPNLRFVDLDGDGLTDLLVTEGDGLAWHRSLGEDGFEPARRVALPIDEEAGPRLVFADSTGSIHLADMSGDGLADLVRIRRGSICYWPNLGHGRFGAKVTMDDAPDFDRPELFDPRRLRLADIDGSGPTDLIYLHAEGARLYFNRCGNAWSTARALAAFPKIDDRVGIDVADLLGNGTACLVWSSPLPDDERRPMRFVSLMGAQKPHLLVRVLNNLGAETRIRYAPSTKFYLKDRLDGRPWLTKLPFPVPVVERVETIDHVGRSRFVARYAYHHGHYDGEEREFRGFGMVERWDTEEYSALAGGPPPAAGTDPASNVPPVLTRSWFHTGLWFGRGHVSDYFAGLLGPAGSGEYYREPGLSDAQARALLLPDTVLPTGLTLEEEREACRALKGSMLREEVYALDSTARDGHPYTVAEQNFAVRLEQARGPNRHAVFHVHRAEALTFDYERNPADPRIQHSLTLEIDGFGNSTKEAAIGYGRRTPDASLPLQSDRDRQTTALIAYSEHAFTNPIEGSAFPFDRRTPLPCETRTWELTGYVPTGPAGRFRPADLVAPAGSGLIHLFDAEAAYEEAPAPGRQRRLIEHGRTLYRADDLAALLPLGTAQPRALAGESYRLAFTAGLLAGAYERGGQALILDPDALLGSAGGDGGGYLSSDRAKAEGRFPAADHDGHWWIPSGREFLSPGPGDTPAQELAFASSHFFLSRRVRDPFHSDTVGTETLLVWDDHDLLLRETRDAVGNRVTAGERAPDGSIDPATAGNDYRVLGPALVSDPNRNRTEVAFDALGQVVGTAVMGRPGEGLGDSLAGFDPDPAEAAVIAHFADPLSAPNALLGRATSREVYDIHSWHRTRNLPEPLPAARCTLTRETHDSDLGPGEVPRIQHSLSYSDGFGREIQRKIQAEPGPLVPGGPNVAPRWVASGWTIFNNKGKPVREYEPFFSAGHGFEFGILAGVGPILFYDPAGRVVATLNPDHSWEKVAFGPWRQVRWDRNDTVLGDPRTDPDVGGIVGPYFAALAAGPGPAWQSWHSQRQSGALGPEAQAAAAAAAGHSETPSTVHLDTLGRAFLTIADNGPDPLQPNSNLRFATRVELDIEGNERVIRDPIEQAGDLRGRIVMVYSYDMLGNRIRQSSMEAGERWALADAAGKPLRSWNSRGHAFRTGYDPLRRPLRSLASGVDSADPPRELVTERLIYGEQHPQAEPNNLRGKLWSHLDQAGAVSTEANDFKGNPLGSARRLTGGISYRQAMDWASVDADVVALPPDPSAPIDLLALEAALLPRLEAQSYSSATSYDARNRPVTLTTPHLPGMAASILRPRYNEANLLDGVEVNLRSEAVGGVPVWTEFVANIHYDSKGRRTRIDFGNGASTSYDYDPLSFRLARLLTRRDPAAFPADCPSTAAPGWPGCQVQDLRYTYDAVGNVTRIEDRAQQAIFFANRRVDASADYSYDPLYRLIEATGREQLGQGGEPIPHSNDDSSRVGLPHPGDGNAVAGYVESYVYDAVGNLLEMRHRGGNPVQPGWTRTYSYTEASLIEDGSSLPLKTSNRLSATTVGSTNPQVERYVHDSHGNMVRMPHLGGGHPASNMDWDERDRLRRVDLGGGGEAFYVYDSGGQRVRKVWEKSANLTEERIYLGGFEIFRRRQGTDLLERETLHVMDDFRRIALVETRTIDSAGTDSGPGRLIRYQFDNHLGSASLELDEQGKIVSYEDYAPYGGTTYQAARNLAEAPKRYRYTGKERDEESGLYYHGARYYAAWLGRWASADPIGIGDGANLYAYVHDNPARLVDSTGSQGHPLTEDPKKRFAVAATTAVVKNLNIADMSGPAYFTVKVGDTELPVYNPGRVPISQYKYPTQPQPRQDQVYAAEIPEEHLAPGALAAKNYKDAVNAYGGDSFWMKASIALYTIIFPGLNELDGAIHQGGALRPGTAPKAEHAHTIKYSEKPSSAANTYEIGSGKATSGKKTALDSKSRSFEPTMWEGSIEAQGKAGENLLKQQNPTWIRLEGNFKRIHYYEWNSETAISVKTYNFNTKARIENPGSMFSTMKGYIDKLAAFEGDVKLGVEVSSEIIKNRELHAVLPLNPSQDVQQQMQKVKEYGQGVGVQVHFTYSR